MPSAAFYRRVSATGKQVTIAHGLEIKIEKSRFHSSILVKNQTFVKEADIMIKKLTPELIAKLKRDFETADYSRSEGLTPAEIEAKVNERTENAPCGEPFIITRAYLLKLMTENFRIDFNPETYFRRKIRPRRGL